MNFHGLQRFSLLQDFTDTELRELFAAATEQRFAVGTFLCREGEPGGSLYFIVSGQVEVSKKGKDGGLHTLTQLSDGSLLGELSWITGAAYTASVQAKQETVAIRLDGGDVTQQSQNNSVGARKFTAALLKMLAGRFMRVNEQVLDLRANLEGQKKGEIERLRERILRDWSF
jgi:CRP-like cAMP-binding protein